LRLCGYASLRDTRGGLIPTYEFFLDGSGVIASEDPEASDSVGPVDGG